MKRIHVLFISKRIYLGREIKSDGGLEYFSDGDAPFFEDIINFRLSFPTPDIKGRNFSRAGCQKLSKGGDILLERIVAQSRYYSLILSGFSNHLDGKILGPGKNSFGRYLHGQMKVKCPPPGKFSVIGHIFF